MKQLTALILVLCTAFIASAATRPNIIIILADDLGYGDLGCYGHPTIHTPNIDRMAKEGLRFTDYYSGQCYCTPSRAALITGRLAIRSGMAGHDTRHVLYPNNPGGLPHDEVTIASALKSQGYATCAIGKWHLGDLQDYLPTKYGFDNFYGLPYSNDSDWIDPKYRNADTLSLNPDFHHFNVPLYRGTNIIERPVDQHTLTKRYTEEALRFLDENKKHPFFLYFAHTFPHVPLFASEKFRGTSRRGLYGDAVEELDWSVGEVMNWLRQQHLDKNTFVVFTSDNGPWLQKKWNGGSAGLLRDGKGGTWEGGTRVPAIAWFPGKIKPGQTTHEIASAMDLFNTSLILGGAKIPTDRPIDGVDLSPILFKNGKSNREVQYFYQTDELFAVRKGNFKAHFWTHDGYSKAKPEQHNPPLLYNVSVDPSEKFDIAAQHPQIVAELTSIFERHRATVTHGKAQY
jgi:arylsulfatase A